ncbi:hypothetical protein WKW50_05420 [Ochrobactrum sp. GPK 3]
MATEIALDPNGIIAAVRECARMTAPDLTDSEFDALRVKLDPLFIDTKHQMEHAIRAYLSAAKFTASRKQVLEDVARWHDAEAERKRTVAVRNKRLEAQIATHEVSAARFRVLAAAPEPAYPCPPVTVLYTNYRGETSERTITPIRPWFGSTEWHSEPQWLLRAYDHGKGAERDFAFKDFGSLPLVPPGDKEMYLAGMTEAAEIADAAINCSCDQCEGRRVAANFIRERITEIADKSDEAGAQWEEIERAEFHRGYVLACANIVNLHGADVAVMEGFAQLGISKAELQALDLCEYDQKAIDTLEDFFGADKLYRTSAPASEGAE